MLKFTQEDVPIVGEKKELKALKQLQRVLEEQIDSVHEEMVEIQALRIEQGDDPIYKH